LGPSLFWIQAREEKVVIYTKFAARSEPIPDTDHNRLQAFAEIFMIEFYTGSSNLYSFPLLALISTDRVSQSHCGTGGSSYPEDTGVFREMHSIILISIPII